MRQSDPDAPTFAPLAEKLAAADARLRALEGRLDRAQATRTTAERGVAEAIREFAAARVPALQTVLERQETELHQRADEFETGQRARHAEHLETYHQAERIAREAGLAGPKPTAWAPHPAMPRGGWWELTGACVEANRSRARAREEQSSRESGPAYERLVAAIVKSAREAPRNSAGDGARYLVTQPPGTPVPGIGFVAQGEWFTAPEGFIPSRTFLPINAAAAETLERVHGVRREPVSPPTPPSPAPGKRPVLTPVEVDEVVKQSTSRAL